MPSFRDKWKKLVCEVASTSKCVCSPCWFIPKNGGFEKMELKKMLGYFKSVAVLCKSTLLTMEQAFDPT
eukprot:4587439-Amphidinium_carterae.3